jgi:hypothetical protein
MSETATSGNQSEEAGSFFERPEVYLETIPVGPGVPLGIEQARNLRIGIGGAYGTWGKPSPTPKGSTSPNSDSCADITFQH